MVVVWLVDPASVHKAFPDLVGNVIYAVGMISLVSTSTLDLFCQVRDPETCLLSGERAVEAGQWQQQ